MATERKRKPKPDHVHPEQVAEQNCDVWFISPGMDADEARRCKHFVEYQWCRLMVKLGMTGRWDVTVTARSRK